jgi:hypothetical protein
MLFVWSYMSWSIIFGHTVSGMQKESNCLDYWCIIWVYLFLFYIPDMPNKRSKSEIAAARHYKKKDHKRRLFVAAKSLFVAAIDQ